MRENKIIIITMVLNLITACIKLLSGIIFSFSTLIADSIQSFMDFITDITSLIANKIGKRRANKTHPFGYGQVYYLANLFTGVLLFLIGLFILYQFFFFKGNLKPNLVLFISLIIVLIIKLIVVNLLNHYGRKFKSELLIEAAKESNTDFISTCVVLVVLILSLLKLPLDIDKIGSLCMALYVFYISIKMIKDNISEFIITTEENNDMKEEVINLLKKFKEVELKDIKFVKISSYYSVSIQIVVKENIRIRKYLTIERQIKKYLRSKNKLIKFIDIEPL